MLLAVHMRERHRNLGASSKIDIEKAAEKYYETKVYPFFTEMTYSMMSINSKINYLQLKELLDKMIVKMQDIKKKITSGIYTSGAYLQTKPYSSHFYVKEIYNKYLETLELNFFISKPNPLIKVGIHIINNIQ